MTRERKAVETGLRSKGFRQKEGDHHYFIYWSKDEKKSIVKTKTSHTPKMKSLSDNLICAMARQCHLTKAEFIRLVDCPLSRDEYETILAEKEVI